MNVHDIHLTEPVLAAAIAENIHGSAEHRLCDEYVAPFVMRAESLARAAEGKNALADAFWFLARVTSFRLKPDDQHQPLLPLLVTPSPGSPGIDDLTNEQIAVVAQAAPTVSDPELRARLADLVWIRKRDHQLARLAAVAYTDAAKEILASPHEDLAIARFERALQIAAMLGKQQPLFVETAEVVEGVASHDGEKAYIVALCLDLLLKFRIGDPKTFAQVAESRVTGGGGKNDPLWQRRFWELSAQFYDRATLADDATRARIEVARTYERDSEEALNRTPPSNLLAMGFLWHAVEAYRRVSGTGTDRERVHLQLLECQKRAVNEIPPTPIGAFDPSDLARQSRD